MIEKNTKRKANMELLRCIAMVMIILQHLGDRTEAMFSNSTPLINELFCNFIRILGTNGVNCFVLITGYFMITQKFKLKKLTRLYFKVFMYGFVASCILCLIGYADYSLFQWVENIFPVLTMRYWYISIYIGLYLITPFLNEFLLKLNQKKYFLMLIIEGVLYSIISIVTIEEIWVSRFIWFIFLYSLAAYVRLYPQRFRISSVKCFLFSIATLFLLWLSVQALKLAGIYVAAAADHIYYFTANWYIFDLVISFMLFLGCLNLDINSNIILIGGRVSLAVYILHSTISPFEKIFRMSAFTESYLFIPYALLCTLITYLVCGVIDVAVDKLIGNRIVKVTDRVSDKVEVTVLRGLDTLYEKHFN